MSGKSHIAAKAAVIASYALLIAAAAAIFIHTASEPLYPNDPRFHIDDIILPLGYFAGITVIQLLVFHLSKPPAKPFKALIIIAALKMAITFVTEYRWDIYNIQFFRQEAVFHSSLIVIFMITIVIVGITEITCAAVMAKKYKKERMAKVREGAGQ